MRVSLAGLEIDAVSVAGIRTCIQIPSAKVCFDLGGCPPSAARCHTVCLTHPHVDHVGGIAHHMALRALWGMKPARYLVPEPYVADIGVLLDTFRRLDRSDLPAEIVPVSHGDVIPIGKGRRIHVFRAYHRVPTLGYAVEQTRRRLKPELAGTPGKQLAALRAAGEEVHVEHTVVEVAFCGDTNASVLSRQALPRAARVLILECTFLDEAGSGRRAQRSGHVHLRALARKAECFVDNEAVLLTHFSSRYAPKEILDRLDAVLPPELRAKVVPLIQEPMEMT